MTDDLKHFHVPTIWSQVKDKVWACLSFLLWIFAMIQPNHQTKAEYLKAEQNASLLAACFRGHPLVWHDPMDGRKRIIPCDQQQVQR